MRSFVKTADGLVPQSQPKIKTYECSTDLYCAIENGDIGEGESFQVDVIEGIHEDIAADVCYLLSVTPSNASPSNKLVTQSDLNAASSGLDTRVTTLECNICNKDCIQAALDCKTDCSYSTALAARVGVNETNITNLQNSRLCCCDFTTCWTALGVITDRLTDCDLCRQAEITCLDGRVDDIDELIPSGATSTNQLVDASTMASCACSIADTQIATHAGVDCTGTLVASDIAGLTSCKGTVTCVGIGSGTTYGPDSNGKVTIPDYPPDLSSCPGISCVGKVTGVCVNGSEYTPDSSGKVTLPGYPNLGYCMNLVGTTLYITEV